MKNRILNYNFLLMGIILVFSNSCKKKDTDSNNTIPVKSTQIIFNPNLTYGTLTDIDGNIYKTITMGYQTWMAENLKVTRFRNGDTIRKITDNNQWSNLTANAYCDYDNSTTNSEIYGKLYNWYAANDIRMIAPNGWHLPSNDEWSILFDYLGGDTISGYKLKEIGSNHWYGTANYANNSSGFTGIPGGCRFSYGTFNFINQNGYWWTSLQKNSIEAYFIGLYDGSNKGVNHNMSFGKEYGLSVRCVKD